MTLHDKTFVNKRASNQRILTNDKENLNCSNSNDLQNMNELIKRGMNKFQKFIKHQIEVQALEHEALKKKDQIMK